MTAHWPQISENLKKSLDSGVFKVWIAPLHGTAHGQTLCLTAPSAYAADWIRQRLGTALQEAAAPVLDCAVSDIVLDISVAANPPPVAPTTANHHTTQALATAPPRLIASPSGPSTHSGSTNQGHLAYNSAPLPVFRWRYDFEDFVIGPSNAVAAAAAQDICRPASPVEMLFVSAPSGLGKTHLIHSIGRAIGRNPHTQEPSRIACLTAEEFTSRFVQAMRTGQMDAFKTALRHLDILLLEDVHFLQGKEKTQDEALATIKCLQARGSRIVLTSTFTPRELQQVDSQLVSHFCAGLLTHIGKPTVDMRRDILSRKARLHQVLLPDTVTDLLAQRLDNDVRQLESCLNNLIFKARHLNRQICLDLALDVLGQYAATNPHINVEQITRLVCESYGLSQRELASRSRRHECVLARSTAYYLARKHTSLSLQEIGATFNRRHSTVIKGITSLEREVQRASVVGRQLATTVSLIERNAGVDLRIHT